MRINKWLLPLALLAGIVSYVAYRTRPVKTPRNKWRRFAEAEALELVQCQQLEGIYHVEDGSDFLGRAAVLKWTYTVEVNETLQHLSFFCEKNGLYIVCEGRFCSGEILLQGYWRKAASNGTGTVQLVAKKLVAGGLVISGHYGYDDVLPGEPLRFVFQQSLPHKQPFAILGHRGGARNVDFLPVSENTTDMLKSAARLGATGVEIDVRLTKDNVPVVFHDSFLSIHTVQRKIWGGMLHNYTLEALQQIELRKGGTVPTLEACLHTILHCTPLETVWLDIKKECDLSQIRKLQRTYLAEAAAIGRNLQIYIGIPDKQILGCFKKLADHAYAPCLVELDPEYVHEVNAAVWAPQYTGGTQEEEVARMHAAGKKVFVWSLDNKLMIDWYISEGDFDGLITNTPSVAAFWYYTSAEKQKNTQVSGALSAI